jgi:integrase
MRRDIEVTVKSLFRSQSARTDLLSIEHLVLLYIAGLNGARISEILNIQLKHYLGNSRFLCMAAKKSRSFTAVISVVEYDAGWHLKEDLSRRLFTATYNDVWRACRRVGIGNTPPGRSSVARTHAHRYSTAKAVAAICDDITAGEILHHKSTRSVSYYLK